MRTAVFVLAVLLLMSASAMAQNTPAAEAALGYSYLRVNPGSGVPGLNFHGGSGSIAFNANDYFGIVADFGGYHHSETVSGVSVDANVFSYLFGPRLSYRKNEKVTPFAQVLFGGARASGSAFGVSASENAFAMAAGGGIDVKASERVAIRLIQAEYVMTRFSQETQNNIRISAGIVFRIGKR